MFTAGSTGFGYRGRGALAADERGNTSDFHLRGQEGQEAPVQRTTRRPSTCGCSPRVRSGLPPREDRTSNPVGPVRGVIGLVGWRGLFQAVRHIG